MGRIFKITGLRWIPIGKMFTDNTTKVDSDNSKLSSKNDDITNPYESDRNTYVRCRSDSCCCSRAVDPAGLPSSTTIDQDVPSASTSPTNQEIQSQVTHQGVEEQIYGHQNA
ncbi:hypothetical protein Tco_0812306 [Tanacetum coccineum]